MTGPTIDLARVMRAMALRWNQDPASIDAGDLDREDLSEAVSFRDELGALGYTIVPKAATL